MSKAHRRYQHSWWVQRFQQLGLFGPVTITEHGTIFSNRVVHVNDEKSVKLNVDNQIRWLRETLAKMDEAKRSHRDWNTYFQKEYGEDWELLPDDEKHRLLMWAETIPDGYEPSVTFE